jgi:catechol 2,3-dioxygenase-like lactoylglutathione lyase family enzyme
MGLLQIDHIQLAMPQGGEDDAQRFYRDLLGLAEVEKPHNLKKRGGCWFEKDTIKVHLGVEVDFRPARKAHPGFLVRDLQALAEKLAAAGVAVKRDEPLEGYDRIYVDDPFGNRIELMEPLSVIPAKMGEAREAPPG